MMLKKINKGPQNGPQFNFDGNKKWLNSFVVKVFSHFRS